MDEDMQHLEKELEATNEKWDKLQEGISEKLHHTNEMENELIEFQECVAALEKVSDDVLESVRDVHVLKVPDGEEIDLKSVEIKRHIAKLDEAKKDLEKIEVSYHCFVISVKTLGISH